MVALVTGGSGFIGSNLIDRLISKGFKVKVLTRNITKKSDKNITFFQGDLRDPKSLKGIDKGVDMVFNLAGALPHHHLEDKEYWKTNVDGTRNILEVFKESRIKRFVHVSTVGIYGPSNKIINEDSPLQLDNAYSKTKYEGEKWVLSFYKKYGLPVAIIKPTIGYGPGDLRPGFSTLFRLIKGRKFIQVGSGKNYLHTVYISNLVDGLLLASTHKKAIGEDFIIGDDPCPTIAEIIRTIAKVEGVGVPNFYLPLGSALIIGKFFDIVGALGLPAPLNTNRVKFITENRIYSTKKAKDYLGYKAKVSLFEGIRETYFWYQKR